MIGLADLQKIQQLSLYKPVWTYRNKDEGSPGILQKYFQPSAQQITVSNPLNI